MRALQAARQDQKHVPIFGKWLAHEQRGDCIVTRLAAFNEKSAALEAVDAEAGAQAAADPAGEFDGVPIGVVRGQSNCASDRKSQDRKSTRLNSSHVEISYAV